jgi:flagellar protein FliS
MSNDSPASLYQQLAARGASPVGQVVALYDTILRDFRRAQAALLAGNVEQRVFEMNHVLTVIAHLQSVLNHERGGEAAKTLDRFYNVTRAMTLDASVHCTPESLQTLIHMYTELRQAWHEIEPGSTAAQSSSPQSDSAPSAKIVTPTPAAPGGQDSPRSGNWSA